MATSSRLVQTSPELSVVSLLCTEAQIQFRRHNACVASWAKMVATGLARRRTSKSPTSVTAPFGFTSSVCQSNWSPRLYQQSPRTGRPSLRSPRSPSVSESNHGIWSLIPRDKFEV